MSKLTRKRIATSLQKAICDYGAVDYFDVKEETDDTQDTILLVTDIDVSDSTFRDFETAYLVVTQMLCELYPENVGDAVNFIKTKTRDNRHGKNVLTFHIDVSRISSVF